MAAFQDGEEREGNATTPGALRQIYWPVIAEWPAATPLPR